MIRRPTVYEGSFPQRIQIDLRASKEGIDADEAHRRAVSQSDVQADSGLDRHILLALLDAQALWIESSDRRALRRHLIALLGKLET